MYDTLILLVAFIGGIGIGAVLAAFFIFNFYEGKIMAAIDDLTAQVAQNVTVEGSAITLIQGLASQLAALSAAGGATPAQLTALSQQLNTSATPLAAAITANTPAATPSN